MIAFVAMVAFALDYGYILTMQTDLQRAADAAALAAVQDLVPGSDGTQDLDRTRSTLRSYVAENLDSGFQVADADIEIGRFDTTTIYENLTLLNSGVFDTVRVTLRRDGEINPRFPLFFARALGIRDAAVACTAAAVLQKPQELIVGAGVLPFAVPIDEWNKIGYENVWVIYGDGKIESFDEATGETSTVPGNWGTLDIGSAANSTSDLNDQIENGLHQTHIDKLYEESRIRFPTHIETDHPTWLNGDPGLSVGIKAGVYKAMDDATPRAIPLYRENTSDGGNGLEFKVIGWGMATVVDASFTGAKKTFVKVKRGNRFHGKLAPNPSSDLSVGTTVQGGFTSPVLVQ
jgi:hypothetical protein